MGDDEGGRVLDVLDGEGVRRWCLASLQRLRGAVDELNRLNVYPVKDADTGVNLVTTVQHLCRGLPEAGELPVVLAAMSRAALMGAHGNSGTILSQLLRGVAEAGREASALGGPALADGLRRGADLAYRAVTAPVEGTILTVARVAADAAEEAAGCGGGLPEVAAAAAAAGRSALARTTEQLPALAEAGVVDAGGRGWCLMLDALVEVVGAPGGDGPDDPRDEPALLVPRQPGELEARRESGSDGFGYEVQYLLDAPDAAVDALQARLAALGDSLVVVGGDGLWNVHVHVNDVGAAIEAGVEAGRPHRITVTRFADQISHSSGARSADSGPVPDPRRPRVLMLVEGPELARLVLAAGACPLPADAGGAVNGSAAAPLDARLLAALEAIGGTEVAVLPNDDARRGHVEAAVARAREAGRSVAVVPTRSVVQGLAALAVHDPGRPFGDDLVSMASAAAATRTLEVLEADAGVRGLVDGAETVTGADAFAVAAELLDRVLLAGGDLVTVVTGATAGDLGDRLRDYLAATRPGVEVQLHHGGQPSPLLVAGVE